MTRSLLLIALLLIPRAVSAQTPAGDREAIVAAVQGFFDAMARKDPALAERVMMPEGRLFSISERDGKPVVRGRGIDEFIKSLPAQKAEVIERMWEPDVRISGAIATVWTRYDFHQNGAFSHCGVDAFNLVRTETGWKIVGGMYTIERTGCPASPLGGVK